MVCMTQENDMYLSIAKGFSNPVTLVQSYVLTLHKCTKSSQTETNETVLFKLVDFFSDFVYDFIFCNFPQTQLFKVI